MSELEPSRRRARQQRFFQPSAIKALPVVASCTATSEPRAESLSSYNSTPAVPDVRPASDHKSSLASHSRAARILAGAAGLTAAAGALYLLLADAIASGTAFTPEQRLMPVVVLTTIASGHLFSAAVRSRRLLSALGFAFLFVAGTSITVVSSVGRNASSIQAHHLQAESVNVQRAAELASLKRNRDMLAEAEGKLATACGDGEGKVCRGVKATVSVYQDALHGNLASLKELGPEIAEDQTAMQIGKVVGLMGGNAARTVALVETVRPFMLSLFCELASIVALGFAFGSSMRPARRSAAHAPRMATHGEVLMTATETAKYPRHPSPKLPEQPLNTPVTAQRKPRASKAIKAAGVVESDKLPKSTAAAEPVKSAEPSSQTEGTEQLSALPKGARVLGSTGRHDGANIIPMTGRHRQAVTEVVTEAVTDRPSPDRGAVVVWVETLAIGQRMQVTQRDLACSLGLSLKSLQAGLGRAVKHGQIGVVTGRHGTVVKRLA